MNNTTDIKVRGYHLDMFSHVNNARYLEFLEEARWNAFEETTMPDLFAQKDYGFAVVNINIDYAYPAGYGATLTVTTTPVKTGSKSATLHQRITLKGTDTVVVDAQVTFVILDRRTGKAVELDGEIRKRMGL